MAIAAVYVNSMDPISNVDRLVLVLRQRLEERSKANSATRPGLKPPTTARSATSLENLRALAGIEDVDDRQLRRAFLQNILADQFGVTLINEAQFQQVVDRVTETLEADPGSSRLLSRLVGELRAAAR